MAGKAHLDFLVQKGPQEIKEIKAPMVKMDPKVKEVPRDHLEFKVQREIMVQLHSKENLVPLDLQDQMECQDNKESVEFKAYLDPSDQKVHLETKGLEEGLVLLVDVDQKVKRK